MTARPQLTAVALLAFALVAPIAMSDDSAAPELHPGDRGTMVTVLEGSRTQEIPVTFLGTYRNFSGPGYDIHLVRLEGPEAERVGVAAGMSGSPVYFDGKMIGALSYRLGLLPKTAVGGVTPLDDMLDSARDTVSAEPDPDGMTKIATPIAAAGLSSGARDWLRPRIAEMGFMLVAGGGSSSDEQAPQALGPGSPVGVELVRGDLRMAATGTVTWVDGDRVYAFGHPFLGTGRVEMPMVAAEVIHTLADLAGSVKLASVGAELGAVTEDRHAAVVGRLGRRAPMVPVELDLSGGDYGERQYRFEVIESPDLAPLLAAVSVMSALQTDAGYSRESTLMARGLVQMGNLPDLPLEMAVAGGATADATLSVAGELAAILGALWRNPFVDPDVQSVRLEIEARREIVSYELESLHYDRKPLRPGETLSVRAVLKPYRGEPISAVLDLKLPESLPRGTPLVLAVGNPRAIDVMLGNVLSRRFHSAADPEAYVRVLADLHAAQRLTAVIVEYGGAVIAGGDAFFQLPATAERLLATQSADTRRGQSSVSPLAWAEINLDGPVTGWRQARLELGGRAAHEEP